MLQRASVLLKSGGAQPQSSDPAAPNAAPKSAENMSVMSISSRASRIFNTGAAPPRGAEDEGPEVELVVKAGDLVETLELCTVRAGESLDAPTVAELPRGVTLTCQFLGESNRRIKVQTGNGITGWISLKTKKNQPLVMRSIVREDDFEVGGVHEVKSIGLTMRSLENLDSETLEELKTGETIKIVELGAMNRRRAKVQVGDKIGWVSLVTNEGQYLIGKVGGNASALDEVRALNKRSSISYIGSTGDNVAIKELLEAARENHLPGVKAKIEPGRKSILSSAPAKVSINASDIRGKTALMYASAFGHTSIVQYLLTSPECNVNGTDDMMKTALHHASKPGGSGGLSIVDTAASAAIIKMLINSGARLEAKDHNERTALMLASSAGAANVIAVLLEAKADASKKDDQGFTAFDLAINADWPRNILDLFGDKPPRGAAGAGGAFGYVSTSASTTSAKAPEPSAKEAAQTEAIVSDTGASPAEPDGGAEAPAGESPKKATGKKKSIVKKKAKAAPKKDAGAADNPENEAAEAAEEPDEATAETTPGAEEEVGAEPSSSGLAPEGDAAAEGAPAKAKAKAKGKKKFVKKKSGIAGEKEGEEAEEQKEGEEEDEGSPGKEDGSSSATKKKKGTVKKGTAKKKAKEEGAPDDAASPDADGPESAPASPGGDEQELPLQPGDIAA